MAVVISMHPPPPPPTKNRKRKKSAYFLDLSLPYFRQNATADTTTYTELGKEEEEALLHTRSPSPPMHGASNLCDSRSRHATGGL